jgi:RNA polymerase sigma factor (sigma-70 family)
MTAMNSPSVSIFHRRLPARTRRTDWTACSDVELVLAARTQDAEGKAAFVEIVRRHQTAVCAVAYSVTGRVGMADDIAQETFLKAWKRLATLREPAKLKAWLTKIAHDCAVDALRREKPGLPLDDERVNRTVAPDVAPDDAAADAEQEAMVWSALAELPETVRTPLVLYYREGQSVAAVAAALDLSEDAVRQRLSRGRTELREQVAAKIEGVLGRVRPNPLLIATVASAIGLAATPETLAAAATGQSGTSSAVSGTSASWIATAAALVAAVPLGWNLRAPAPAAHAVPSATTPAPADPLAEFADSALLREWRRLHAEHGRDAAAMPVIFEAVEKLETDFHRRALRHALLLEWAGVEPAGGLDFLRAKNQPAHAIVIAREWLRHDPASAAGWLAAAAPGAPEIVRALLMEIAERTPENLVAVAGDLAMPEDAGKKEITGAFEIWAARYPAAARAAAENMKGPQAAAALTGVAAGWAQRDGAAAAAWARAMEKGGTRDAVLTAAIVAWGRMDPLAALACYEEVPPDARPGHSGGQEALMRAAVERDPDSSLEWVRAHADKIRSSGVFDAFSSVLDERFRKDPDRFLTWLGGYGETGRKVLFQSLCRRALDTPEHCERLWNWVAALPANHTQHELRDWMIRIAPDAEQALAWMKLLPDDWLSRSVIMNQLDARFLSRLSTDPGESRAAVYERIMAGMPPALQAGLYEKALQTTVEWDEAMREKWRARVLAAPQQVNEQYRIAAAAAQSIARMDPAGAIAWARSLPEPRLHNPALSAAVSIWAEGDPAGASTWLNAQPPGPEKRAATVALVHAVREEDPAGAIAWAATLPGGTLGEENWCELIEALHHKDPVQARATADTAPMPEGARIWFLEKYGEPSPVKKP